VRPTERRRKKKGLEREGQGSTRIEKRVRVSEGVMVGGRAVPVY